MNIDEKELRVTKLKEYLVDLISEIKIGSPEINVDRLSKDTNKYSLDKIPTDIEIETWITGEEIHQDVFSFRSRFNYDYNVVNNLLNIGFFEEFEEKIRQNNKDKILPNIDGIQSIRCNNCGSLNNADTNTAEFDIQIQITYIK